MSIENGKCPSCGGALLLDSSKEKTVCKYCGHQVVIPQAVQKCVIDGIADFDTLMLTAQGALDFDGDFDKARENYLQALKLHIRLQILVPVFRLLDLLLSLGSLGDGESCSCSRLSCTTCSDDQNIPWPMCISGLSSESFVIDFFQP